MLIFIAIFFTLIMIALFSSNIIVSEFFFAKVEPYVSLEVLIISFFCDIWMSLILLVCFTEKIYTVVSLGFIFAPVFVSSAIVLIFSYFVPQFFCYKCFTGIFKHFYFDGYKFIKDIIKSGMTVKTKFSPQCFIK